MDCSYGFFVLLCMYVDLEFVCIAVRLTDILKRADTVRVCYLFSG